MENNKWFPYAKSASDVVPEETRIPIATPCLDARGDFFKLFLFLPSARSLTPRHRLSALVLALIQYDLISVISSGIGHLFFSAWTIGPSY